MAGCTARQTPAMAPRAEQHLPAIAPRAAQVVFRRASSPCDSSDHAIVVDETGQFLGTLAPDTAFAVNTTPGRHAYSVWPGMDLRQEKDPSFRPVGVLEASLKPNEHRAVDVAVVLPREGRGHCQSYAVFYFEKTNGSSSLEGESMGSVRIMQPDAVAGQAYLREKKELSAAYFNMAHDILDTRRAAKTEADRRTQRLRDANLQ